MNEENTLKDLLERLKSPANTVRMKAKILKKINGLLSKLLKGSQEKKE